MRFSFVFACWSLTASAACLCVVLFLLGSVFEIHFRERAPVFGGFLAVFGFSVMFCLCVFVILFSQEKRLVKISLSKAQFLKFIFGCELLFFVFC